MSARLSAQRRFLPHRIVAALLFLEHGTQKLLELPARLVDADARHALA